MIAIQNISKRLSATGLQSYEIRINETVIATFRHRREEGLAVCLERAAKAVKEHADLMTHRDRLGA